MGDMTRNLIVTALVAVIMAGFVLTYTFLAPTQAQQPRDMASTTGPTVPPVKGYTEGQEIRFIHTETSDPKIAQILTDMMGSPVLVVPALAQAPESMLANVYVFKNGIKGNGPLGFQPDVFDSPSESEGYSPLRALNLVTWKDEQAARELTSATEVQEAETKGAVTIEQPGVVINMPMLTWPGGQR